MSQQWEERTENLTRSVLISTTCDLCGAVKDDYHDWADEDGKVLLENVETVEIEMKEGQIWGSDGGSHKSTTYDICTTCFRTRVMPWLASQGATPRYRWLDY